ncbi:MAG: TrlF family AAA-like ATPase [Candidatus Helarchaeota archaeon]
MKGLRWRKCIFHAHTPASHDFEESQKDITPEEYLKRAIEAGIEILCVTDHHSIEWIEKLRKAAQKLQQKEDLRIVLIPGIEIHTWDSVHVLIYFDPTIESQKLRQFFGALEIPPDPSSFTNHNYQCSIKLENNELFNKVNEYNGLCVFAHVKNRSKGLLEACRGHGIKEQIINAKKYPFECKKNEIDQVRQSAPGNAIINFSDIHRIEDFSDPQRITWIKTGRNVVLLSLKQIIFDPEFRVKLEPPNDIEHTHIKEFIPNSKYFEISKFMFNPELNVLIGGRGTGKSSCIDMLRYVLGIYPKEFTTLKKFLNKLNAQIEDGNELTIYFWKENKNYRIMRRFKTFKKTKFKNIEDANKYLTSYFKNSSILMEIEVKNTWTSFNQKSSPSDLIPIDIYGQTEVQSIIKDEDNLLDIIDSFSDVFRRHENLKKYKRIKVEKIQEIEQIELKLIEQYDKLQKPDTIEKKIEKLKSEISDLEDKLTIDTLKEQSTWEQQDEYFNELLDELETHIIGNLDKVKLEKISFKQILTEDKFSFENIKKNFFEINTLINTINKSFKNIRNLVKSIEKEITITWKNVFQEFKRNLRESLGGEDKEENITQTTIQNQIDTKHRQLINFNSKKEKNKDLIENIKKLESRRRELIKEYFENEDALLKERKYVAENITSKVTGVKVSIEYNPITNFLELLQKLYTDRKDIRNKYSLYNSICNNFNPNDFFKFLTNEDIFQEMKDRLKVSETIKHNLRSEFCENPYDGLGIFGRAIPNLLKLERLALNQKVTIHYYKKNDWKNLSDLSLGEQCSVFLAILLINSRKILIIDQPEDELDYDSRKELIQMLKNNKSNRQIILVTHFQNIPVLADAELIIKMEEVEKHGKIEKQGCFEEMIPEIISMEGGKEAFLKREMKYRDELTRSEMINISGN